MASLSGVDVEPDLRKIDPAILFRIAPGAISAPQSMPAQEEPPVSVLIRLASDDDGLPDQVRNLGGTARKILPRIYAARMPTDATRYLSHRPAILYMEPDRIVWPLLDVSRPAVSADIREWFPRVRGGGVLRLHPGLSIRCQARRHRSEQLSVTVSERLAGATTAPSLFG